jgi:hypothetical protein
MGGAMPGKGPTHRRHQDEVDQVVNALQHLRGRRAEVEHHQAAARPLHEASYLEDELMSRLMEHL